jgi:hypothetical protein
VTQHIRIGFSAAAVIAIAMLYSVTGVFAAGALAIGTCDRFGYSYNHPNPGLAQARALTECASNGDNRCRVVVNTRNNCGAFAIDASNRCGARGWGRAPNRRRAERIAVDQCFKYGGSNCRVQGWTCDGGP